ncbi:hypothetical protein J6590_042438, partial [Homalodisca vitripennis]
LKVRAKESSLTLNLGTNELKVTSKPPLMAGQAGCCKDRIVQQSLIQAAATLDVALFGYLPTTVVPATLHPWNLIPQLKITDVSVLICRNNSGEVKGV